MQFLSVLARALLTAPGVFLPYLQRCGDGPDGKGGGMRASIRIFTWKKTQNKSVIHTHITTICHTRRLSIAPPVLADALLGLFDAVPSGSPASGGMGGAYAGTPHSPSSAPARRKLWAMTLVFLLAGGQPEGAGQPQQDGVGERWQALVMGMLGRMEQVGMWL